MQQQAPAEQAYVSEEDGLLHIGGVVVRVDAAGGGTASIPLQQQQQQQRQGGGGGVRRQRRRSGGGPPQPQRAPSSCGGSSSDGDEEMDEREQAVQDYLANLAAGEAEEGEESGSSGIEADTEGDQRSGPGSAAKRRRRQVRDSGRRACRGCWLLRVCVWQGVHVLRSVRACSLDPHHGMRRAAAAECVPSLQQLASILHPLGACSW